MAVIGILLASCSTDTTARIAAERTGQTSSALDASPTLGTFALYAERSVNLGSQDQVRGGDIGVAAAAVASFGAQLSVGSQTQVSRANNLLAPSVTLGHQSQVGDVQTTTLVNNGAQSVGTVAAFPASLMPSLPAANTPATSTFNVTVAAQAHTTIAPGTYGALVVGNQAHVTLAAGTYCFTNVTVGNEVHLAASAPGVTMLVAGTFAAGSQDQINRGGGAVASGLTVLIAGSDGAGGVPAATVGTQTQMTALLAVPHGTLSVAAQAQLAGAFAAFDIGLGNQVQLTYQDGFSNSMPGQVGTQQLSGYVTPSIAAAPLVGPVPPDTVVELGIGLPIRNESGLRADIAQVYNPSSPLYHHYMSPSEFAAAYGPLPAVTGPLVSFIAASGLTLENTYTSNQLFDVSGTAATIGSAFFVTLNIYQRPDGSEFYAPDREPSLNLDPATVPIAHIDGLESFLVAVPLAGSGPVPQPPGQVDHATGVNLSMGSDFRSAYLPGVTVDGAGQTVALVALDSFLPGDLALYKACPDCSPPPSNWSPQVPVDVVPIDHLTLPPPPPTSNETILDIDMVLALAPGLDHIYVYEAPVVPPGSFGPNKASQTKEVNDILALIANPFGQPLSHTVSCSWIDYGSYSTLVSMYQFARQGQSFFQGTGDNGSYFDVGAPAPITDPESAYMTLVGGTQLTTAADKTWLSETTWNDTLARRGNFGATGGGSLSGSLDLFSGSVPVPDYQVPIMSQISAAGGDPSWRAVPDVSMTATDIGIYYNGHLNFADGTSAAGPLWAAFAALVNEKAGPQGTPLGFANPAIYATAESPFYPLVFHDIADNSTNSETASGHYLAIGGYDLATGWGTPNGNLIGLLECSVYCGNSADSCPNLDTDPSNCGACGNSCGAGMCIAGQCGQVTVGMTAASSGLQLCITAAGFIPGDFVHVVFSGAPGGFGGRDGVVDANGQWAYFDEVPYDTSCSSQDVLGSVTIAESDPDAPVQYATEIVPASYFCSPPGAGQPDIGPGARVPAACVAQDGTSGIFFGQ
jgi:hypothetical protein